MSDHENPHGDIRYRQMYVGTVVARNDPSGNGRVCVRIPGLLDPASSWCWPMGSPGGGASGIGIKFVPRMGAEVAVFFKGGDPDVPYFLPAHWATGETPVSTVGGTNPEDCDIIETEAYLIEIDNRPGTRAFRISDKVNGDKIEFDGTAATGPGITIYGTAAVVIKSDGPVIVDALSFTVNGRVLSDGPQPF